MTDDVKAAVEWLQRSIRGPRANRPEGVLMEDLLALQRYIQELEAAVFRNRDLGTSTQYELDDASKHIDGEQARQDAAVAAAREEQREADAKFCPNCLGVGFVERPVPCPYCDDSTHDHYCPTGTQRQQCGCGAERIRATPLTATPLADRIAELEQHKVALAQSLEQMTARVSEVEAERDALRAGFKAAVELLDCSMGVPCRPDLDDRIRSAIAAMDGAKSKQNSTKGTHD